MLFKFKPTLLFFNGAPTRAYSAHHHYEAGDKVGQIVIIPYPEIEFEEADELSPSDRGSGGYGSTGR